MRVGVPTEVKNSEFRVAVTPAGVHALVGRGHEVLVQAGAGVGSGIPDSDFVGAGARVVGDVESVWGDADLVCCMRVWFFLRIFIWLLMRR